MNRAYRVALACGALPLVVGIAVFLLWLATRWDGLMLAGFGTISLGYVAFLTGAVALARSYWLASRDRAVSRPRLVFSTVGCAALLLANFPVAGGIIVAVERIETCYVIVVNNPSQQPLEQVEISGGGCEEMLGRLAPGSSVGRWLWIERDGMLEFRARSGMSVRQALIDGYVTGGISGHATITVIQMERS